MTRDKKATVDERPLTRTERVHQLLRLAILDQQLAPGVRLPEDTIGEAFGSSRTIAREALGRLAVEGLVELKPNRGAFVANPSLDEGRGMFVIRAALERAMVKELAGRIDAETAENLREMVAKEAAVEGRSDAESIRLAGEFHLHLAALCGNALLQRYINEIVSRCSLVMAMYGRPHSADCGAREHREIVEALIGGDIDRAANLMEHHVEEVASRAQLGVKKECDVRTVLADYAARSDKG